jgi:hypothetical protein
MTKKILVLFPSNFSRRNYGSANGAYIPVKMLKSLGFSLDLFSINAIDDFSDFDDFNKDKLIDTLFLVDVNKKQFFFRLKRKIKKILGLVYPDTFALDPVLIKFRQIINTNYTANESG